MMLKKRGLATVLVLIILLSFSGFAEEDGDGTSEPEVIPAISGGVTFLGGTSDTTSDSCTDNHELVPNTLGESDCNLEALTWGINPLLNLGIRGCPIGMEEYDSGTAYNDASVALVLPGTIVDNNLKTYHQYVVAADAWECTNDDDDTGEGDDFEGPADLGSLNAGELYDGITQPAHCHYSAAKTSVTTYPSFVCASDHIWYPCYELNEGLFEETRVPAYQWEQQDSDLDRDGYSTSDGDCQDNPQKDPVGLDCPTIEDLEEDTASGTSSVGKSIEQIRDDARGLCRDNPQRYSQCAICINPGAAEVCGDHLNNDCGGEDLTFDVNVDDEKTPDSCHENQAACEQAPVFVGEEATEEEGT
ncbi:hypothetical protein HYU08_01595, partial [Candidatus Woesearchaeota archaeon]|nr:hypothetical protein [Candidatus Woesearchaeota archaeon]